MAIILVVDDEENIREMLYERLSVDGHTVIKANDGYSAKKLIASQPFDLVVTDIIMPDIDGLELIRYIKQENPKLKIIAMSAGGQLGTTDMYLYPAKSMGADLRIDKPFNLDEMAFSVADLLKSDK